MIRKKTKVIKKEEYIDIPLLSSLQPQGGITFKDPSFINTGSGYVKVIHIYGLPGILTDYWLENVFSIRDTIATIDIATRDKNEVKKNINKSIKEEYARERAAKDFEEMYDAQQRQARLQSMYDEIQSLGESVKMVHFRIFVPGRNLLELEAKVDKMMGNLEADHFMPTILLNEGKREYESLFLPFEEQHKSLFYIKGHSLMTEQLAGGYPFHYSSLEDRHGTLLGFTNCGGPVVFDIFEKTQQRSYYNGIIIGTQGSGKSTTLKKLFEVRAAEGDFVRCFDIAGEFKALTREFGGKIIKCDGTEGMLNPFEILRAGDDEFTSFAKHISKISTLYKCLKPSMKDEEVIKLENLLKEFYTKEDLIPDNGKAITGLPASNYPTFSGFEEFLLTKIDELSSIKDVGAVEQEGLARQLLIIISIEEITNNVIGNYGKMLDGVTSVDSITDEKIVTFDISTIKDLGNVFIAVIFNMISLCWDNCIANGSIMKNLWENSASEYEDIVKSIIIMDEAHRYINARMPKILENIITYLREARKYFIAFLLASQNLRDYMPEGLNDSNIDLIKTVFELMQYKFILKQDSAVIPLLQTVFSGAFTFSQIQKIPKLSQGQVILSIAGDKSIEFKVWLSTEYEKPLHQGGR